MPFAKRACSSLKTCRTITILNWQRTSPPRLIGSVVDSISALTCVSNLFFLSLHGSTRLTLYLSCLCQFETLDLNFQEEIEKFLQERGINESLAFFVPEYAQHKEQKVEIPTILSYALIVDGFLRVIIGICQLARKSQELR
jgi:hypothetical protein